MVAGWYPHEFWLTTSGSEEQNASTSTVRIAGSSQANPYACIAAGGDQNGQGSVEIFPETLERGFLSDNN